MRSGIIPSPGHSRAHVLSSCTLARAGIARLLAESGWSLTDNPAECAPSLVVVWLAVPLREQLVALECLRRLLEAQDRMPGVLLACRMASDWLWQCLPQSIPAHLRMVDAGLSVSGWRNVFTGGEGAVSVSGGQGKYLRDAGLTRREMQALHDLLEGRQVRTLSVRYGLSPKTLYIHRHNALKKMAAALTPGTVSLHVRRNRLFRELAISYAWLAGGGG